MSTKLWYVVKNDGSQHYSTRVWIPKPANDAGNVVQFRKPA